MWQKSKLDPETVRRLYVDEGLTPRQISERFGVSHQAVYERLRRLGVKTDRTRPAKIKADQDALRKKVDLDTLRKLYVEQQLSLCDTGRIMGADASLLRRILVIEGVEIRPIRFYIRRKFPQIYELKIGESVVIPLPNARFPHSNLHGSARKAKMRISVKIVSPGIFQVTRLS